MKPEKYGSKEGLAAYGYEEFFKVSSVSLVAATIDAKSKRRDAETQQHKKVHKPFEKVLQEKTERLQTNDATTFQMAGYTRDAKSIYYMVPQREYV